MKITDRQKKNDGQQIGPILHIASDYDIVMRKMETYLPEQREGTLKTNVPYKKRLIYLTIDRSIV